MFTPKQYAYAATALGWEVEIIESVCLKEIAGKKFTFNHKGRELQKIVFEKHKFWELLIAKGFDPRAILDRDASFADVLGQAPYKTYGSYIKQYQRRDRAMQIDRECAFAACSYGSFQILGLHHQKCGYESAETFAEAMTDVNQHIPAFVNFIKAEGLEKYFQGIRDFEGFARRYNGKDYWRKGYHIELARIYQRILARNLPRHDSVVKAVLQSSTVQRGTAVVATGSLPTVGLLAESDTLNQLIETVRQYADKGREISDQIHILQAQADSLAPYLNWLPWAAGGWTVLLLIVFWLLVRRYLSDRGYLG